MRNASLAQLEANAKPREVTNPVNRMRLYVIPGDDWMSQGASIPPDVAWSRSSDSLAQMPTVHRAETE